MSKFLLMNEKDLKETLDFKRTLIKDLKKKISELESDIVGIKEALLQKEDQGLKKFGI